MNHLVYSSSHVGGGAIKLDPQCKLFIGGLSYETTDESLAQYFARFGEIAQAAVMRDADTGRSRGFGFVTFRTQDCAQDALRATHHVVDGRKVESKFAVPRNRPTTPSTTSTASTMSISSSSSSATSQRHESPQSLAFMDHHHQSHHDFHVSDYPAIVLQQRQSMTSPFAPDFNLISTSSGGGNLTGGEIVNNKIFVGGLKYATNADMLKRFFEDLFGEVDSAQIILNRDTKKSRGFGFVIFTNPLSVDLVLNRQSSNPLMIEGKQVEVRACTARHTMLPQTPIHMHPSQQSHQHHHQPDSNGFRSPWTPLGGSRTAFESPPPASGTVSSFTVFRPQATYSARANFSQPQQSQQPTFGGGNPDLGLFDMSLVANQLPSPTLSADMSPSDFQHDLLVADQQSLGNLSLSGMPLSATTTSISSPRAGVFRPPGWQQQQQRQSTSTLMDSSLFADPFSPSSTRAHEQHSLFSSPDPSMMFSPDASSMFASPSKLSSTNNNLTTSNNSGGNSSSPRNELTRSPVMSGSLAFPSLGSQTIW
ncbi:hypothetical protein BASA81_008049 [Batrachochytrium salamandrivorans]|nr:hypothetical protein BASA81_008049 [Batrachochytrium salamandrivorans]